jgi:acyl carrier protein
LPPAALERIERAFAAPVLEGYGLTETSPTMTSNPLPPRVRKAGSVGVPVGCEIRIVDEADEPLPAGLVGEVIVRGPNVMAGYLDDPDGNAAAFTGDGWLRTGDLGSIDQDGYLFLTGRLKEMINRGGQKVSPLEVEATLREHPAVAAATVFAMPDERLGEEVAAAIVARDGMTIEPGDLRAFVTRRLAWHKAPRRIVVVDRLPTTGTGKPRRVGLAHALGLTDRPDDGRAPRRFAAPRTAAERAVADIWTEVLGQPRIGRFDRLLDLGGDSLAAGRIAAGACETFGVELSLAEVLDHLDVAAIAAIVENQLQTVLAGAAPGEPADA